MAETIYRNYSVALREINSADNYRDKKTQRDLQFAKKFVLNIPNIRTHREFTGTVINYAKSSFTIGEIVLDKIESLATKYGRESLSQGALLLEQAAIGAIRSRF